MKLILMSILATVILHDHEVKASCSVTLDDSNVKDLIEKVLQKKNTVGHHKREMVAFSASKTTCQSLSKGTILKFNKVWTNIGNGYDPNTGIFTTPVEGVYQFTSTVMPQSSGELFVRLYHNNLKTTALYFKAVSSHYNSNTLNIILQIKKGDTISIRSGLDGRQVFSNSDNYNSFSGFLI